MNLKTAKIMCVGELQKSHEHLDRTCCSITGGAQEQHRCANGRESNVANGPAWFYQVTILILDPHFSAPQMPRSVSTRALDKRDTPNTQKLTGVIFKSGWNVNARRQKAMAGL
jgi:hypothetical protein